MTENPVDEPGSGPGPVGEVSDDEDDEVTDEEDDESASTSDSEEEGDSGVAEDSNLEASAADDDSSSTDWQGAELPQARGDEPGALESDPAPAEDDQNEPGLSAMAPSEALESGEDTEVQQDSGDDVALTDQEALEPAESDEEDTESSEPSDEPSGQETSASDPEDSGPDSQDTAEGTQAAEQTQGTSVVAWVGGVLAVLFLAIAAGLVYFFGFARGRIGGKS